MRGQLKCRQRSALSVPCGHRDTNARHVCDTDCDLPVRPPSHCVPRQPQSRVQRTEIKSLIKLMETI